MAFYIDERFAGEVLKPGTTAFVCWNYEENRLRDDEDDYWIGIICSETTMPTKLRQKRPPGGVIPCEDWKVEPKIAAMKEYPVFLPTKGEFYWLPRSALGYILKRQDKYFGVPFKQQHFDFQMLYDMALDKANHGSEYWLGLAKDAAREENARMQDHRTRHETNKSSDVMSTDDGASGDEDDDSHFEQSQDEQPTRKRARSTQSPRPTRTTTVPPRPLPFLPCMESPMTARSSTAATMDSVDGGAKVKLENGDDGGHEMIVVYIGKRNMAFIMSKEELSQSAVLTAYVRGKPFVMDPDLMVVEATLFEAVFEFLKTAEFQPFYVPKEGREDFEPGAGRLDGVNGHTEYSAQLLRLGKLYVMAGKFGISKMQLLIRQKVVAGFPDGWSYKTMLEFVGQIFRDLPGTVENAAAVVPDRSDGVETNDPLKVWLITWLAEYMREYSQSLEKGVPKQYWDTLDKGVGLSLAVHRVKIQIIEKHKGELVKLEDDQRTD